MGGRLRLPIPNLDRQTERERRKENDSLYFSKFFISPNPLVVAGRVFPKVTSVGIVYPLYVPILPPCICVGLSQDDELRLDVYLMYGYIWISYICMDILWIHAHEWMYGEDLCLKTWLPFLPFKPLPHGVVL